MTPPLLATVSRTDIQDDVIGAADCLFTEHGITPVTMEQIGARAGVSPSTLLAAFGTKREIVVAVLALKHRDWARRLTEIGEQTLDPRDEILSIFSYLEECFTDTTWRGCAFVNANNELGRADAGIAALAEQHFDEVEKHIGVVCDRAGMPSHVAQTLTLLIQGARAESGIHHSSQPARAARLGAAMLMSIYEGDAALPDFS